MLAPWLAACLLTFAVVASAFPLRDAAVRAGDRRRLSLGVGAMGVLLAGGFVLALPPPARVLVLLFALTVGLGVVGRAWAGPGELPGHAGRWGTAGLAALAANLVNNLPASMLLSAAVPHHPRALLLGLTSARTWPSPAPCPPTSGSTWLRRQAFGLRSSPIRLSASCSCP